MKILKEDLKNATLLAIDEDVPFSVKTDASDVAVSNILHQKGKPVALFSRTINPSEKCYSCIEKEATAIIESVRRWSRFLLRRRFMLITDQNSVAFMFDHRKRGKAKNAKIMLWRIELAQYSFDIIYREGKLNVASDALSHAYCAATAGNELYPLHTALCHLGATQLFPFVKNKNLPYSLDDVKRVVANCSICCELKPIFTRGAISLMIQSTQPY